MTTTATAIEKAEPIWIEMRDARLDEPQRFVSDHERWIAEITEERDRVGRSRWLWKAGDRKAPTQYSGTAPTKEAAERCVEGVLSDLRGDGGRVFARW